MSKQVKELWGQTQALTWAAEADGKRDRKETDGAAGLCATGGGEGAAGADASAHGQQRQRASATGRRRTVQLGCVQQAAGVSKQVKELWGQTQALTWAAEAEGKREGPKGDRQCSWAVCKRLRAC